MSTSVPDIGVHSGPPGQPEKTLAQLEAIIEKGLPQYGEVALAMLEIHERKLFKPASFAKYLQDRWKMSRSRGYQLLHFARLKKSSTMVDSPTNERRARALAQNGSLRLKTDEDPIEDAMVYLVEVFKKLKLPEKREFIHSIRELLKELEATVSGTANLENEPKLVAVPGSDRESPSSITHPEEPAAKSV